LGKVRLWLLRKSWRRFLWASSRTKLL